MDIATAWTVIYFSVITSAIVLNYVLLERHRGRTVTDWFYDYLMCWKHWLDNITNLVDHWKKRYH